MEEINLDDEISVSDPQKIEQGMRAYVVYKVTSKTNRPYFKNNLSVSRRFSDFLVLHKNLVDRYQNFGIIVPPAPEKSVIAMFKPKVYKNDVVSSDDFIEKRRAALERYINRTASHPILRKDEDLYNFLHNGSDLPKALRDDGGFSVYSSIKETVNEMPVDIDETLWWFAEKQRDFEKLDQEMRKMCGIAKEAVNYRKSISTSEALFARSAATIGIHNKSTDLCKVFLQLAEVKEKMETLEIEQANCDVYLLQELLNDYIGLMAVAKNVFHLKVKAYQAWIQKKETFKALRDRRRDIAVYGETKSPGGVFRVSPNVPKLEKKVVERREKNKIAEAEFITISKIIRNEIEHFERTVVHEFKTTIVKYMEKLLKSHYQMSKYCEKFLPEAKVSMY